MQQKDIEMKHYILQQLRQRGCRITKQREILIDVILREECSNCKEIYYKAAKEEPAIGMATVYRMVNILEEIGALKCRNEYKIFDKKSDGSKKYVIRFSDDSSVELGADSLYKVLERGLEASGYLEGRKVQHILIQEKTCETEKI